MNSHRDTLKYSTIYYRICIEAMQQWNVWFPFVVYKTISAQNITKNLCLRQLIVHTNNELQLKYDSECNSMRFCFLHVIASLRTPLSNNSKTTNDSVAASTCLKTNVFQSNCTHSQYTA